MMHGYAEWQVTELAKLGQFDRERAERALNAVWSAMPGLYEELAQSAGKPFDGAAVDAMALPLTHALVEVAESSVASASPRAASRFGKSFMNIAVRDRWTT